MENINKKAKEISQKAKEINQKANSLVADEIQYVTIPLCDYTMEKERNREEKKHLTNIIAIVSIVSIMALVVAVGGMLFMYNKMNDKYLNTISENSKAFTEFLNQYDFGGYEYEQHEFTPEMAHKWVENMHNEDGTVGEHWTMEQTTEVAKAKGIEFEHITPYCFFTTMNMMYSDYCKVAKFHNVDTVDFYVDMAKAFLFDKDSAKPSEKLYYYYKYIAK